MSHFYISLHDIKLQLPLQPPKKVPSTIVLPLSDHWWSQSYKQQIPQNTWGQTLMKSKRADYLLQQVIFFHIEWENSKCATNYLKFQKCKFVFIWIHHQPWLSFQNVWPRSSEWSLVQMYTRSFVKSYIRTVKSVPHF